MDSCLVIPSPHGLNENVIVGITTSELTKFCTSHHNDLSFCDKQRLAGAFTTLAYHLPVSTYDLIEWIASDPHFNREAIAHYAKDHLGMRRVVKRGSV